MMARVNLWVVCGVLLTGSLCTSTAKAQFLSGGGYGLGFFNYGGYGGYATAERIPYYALYPPVYYSYPVARTYGYSPFAYPPGTMTPQSAPPAAANFINPYRKPAPAAQPAGDKTAGVPRTYINPYVAQARAASSERLSARLER